MDKYDNRDSSSHQIVPQKLKTCSVAVAKYLFHLTFTSEGFISSNFSNTLRGGFGSTLRNIVCTFPGTLRKEYSCSYRCPYGYIFETTISPDTSIMRKYPFAPLVINPYKKLLRYAHSKKWKILKM